MKNIVISFSSDEFDKLKSGMLKFEYRKSLPKDAVTAYFYVSNPTKAIQGVAHFGGREDLVLWKEKYKNRSKDVLNRIDEYLEDCNYVVPIRDFQLTNSISLETIRKDIPGFVVPRMYYYIDNTKLLNYLHSTLIPVNKLIVNSFDTILDEEICR